MHDNFVTWMLLFPLVCAVCGALYDLRRAKPPSEGTKAVAALIDAAIYIYVGYLLF